MSKNNIHNSDTTTVKYLDSTTVIEKGNEHIIIIQDQKKEPTKEWSDNPWIISFLIPLLIASAAAGLAYYLNRRKNSVEIEKLKEETKNLRKTFQPIVIGTLQSIQDKIITDKIDALKQLVQIRNEFSDHEQQYYEGDPIAPDYEQYLELLFHNFSTSDYGNYNKFHDKFSYLFPDKVFDILTELRNKLSKLNENKKSYISLGDPYIELIKNDRKDIEEIISLFSVAIQAIRTDCHLDTSFIHDFIDENRG